MATKLLVFAVLVQASFAFLFSRLQHPTAQAGGREIDPECLQHAQNGSCEFYNCFEQRLPCGRNYYMKKTGGYYCNKTTINMPRFNAAGQQFLRNIKQCLMAPLQVIYANDSVDCHALEHEAVAAIAPCFIEHGFCDVLDANANEFVRIYEFTDLFSRGAGKMSRAMLRIIAQCGSQYVRHFYSYASETLLSSANSFMNSLGSFRSPNIFGNAVDQSEETP